MYIWLYFSGLKVYEVVTIIYKEVFSESNSLYMYMYINLIKYNVITLLKIGYETKNF